MKITKNEIAHGDSRLTGDSVCGMNLSYGNYIFVKGFISGYNDDYIYLSVKNKFGKVTDSHDFVPDFYIDTYKALRCRILLTEKRG